MSFAKEERGKYHYPSENVENGKKGLLSKKMGNNYCTHCNVSGHWVEKCWKFHQ